MRLPDALFMGGDHYVDVAGEGRGCRLLAHASGVVSISLDDPRGRNAFTAAFRAVLFGLLGDAIKDPRVRAVVIRAERGNFSVGGHLASIESLACGPAGHAHMESVREQALQVAQSPKPLVAALTGHCIGAAAGVALLCDTIVMGQGASMGFPFLRLGLAPDFGVSWSLAKRIGSTAARQALLYAKSFDGASALAVGLADELVPEELVAERALELAGQLARSPATALRLTRQLLDRERDALDAALREEAFAQSLCFGSAELREALAARAERREPDFLRVQST